MRTIEDKIKAEIERRIAACKSTDGRILPPRTRHAICFDELTDLLAFIKSLEKQAKRSYKDCNGCEFNRSIKDQIGWEFRGCFGGGYKGKAIAEIDLCPLKVESLEKEQDVKSVAQLEWEEKQHRPHICPRCAYYKYETCYFPHGGLKTTHNENGVCECNGFNEIEKNG